MAETEENKSIQFYCISIGILNLLAAFSYLIYSLNISYGWYLASLICGTCSLSFAAFTFGSFLEYVFFKKRRVIQPPVQQSPTGQDLEMLDSVYYDANVHPPHQGSSEGYVEFSCFMKADQNFGRSHHTETCACHEINVHQSSSSQNENAAIFSTYCKESEFYSELAVTNNKQLTFQSQKYSFCSSVKPVSDQGRLVKTLEHNECLTLDCVTSDLQDLNPSNSEMCATVTKDNKPNAYPKRLDSSIQSQSLGQIQDGPELSLVHEEGPIHPTQLNIPDNLFQAHSDELPGGSGGTRSLEDLNPSNSGVSATVTKDNNPNAYSKRLDSSIQSQSLGHIQDPDLPLVHESRIHPTQLSIPDNSFKAHSDELPGGSGGTRSLQDLNPSNSGVSATVTKKKTPNAYPEGRDSSIQSQSLGQVKVNPELPLTRKKVPTRLSIPDDPSQAHSDELPGLAKDSQSPVMVRDGNSSPIRVQDHNETSLRNQISSQISLDRGYLKADVVFDFIPSPATMMCTSSPGRFVEPSYSVPLSTPSFQDSNTDGSVVVKSDGNVHYFAQI